MAVCRESLDRYGETVTELIRVRESCSNVVWLDLELASLDDPTILVLAPPLLPFPSKALVVS